MTHDELLTKIVEKEPGTLTYSNGEIWHSTRSLVSWQLALRAVVETVEAFEGRGVIANPEFDQGVRSACRVIIEAIEKELQ